MGKSSARRPNNEEDQSPRKARRLLLHSCLRNELRSTDVHIGHPRRSNNSPLPLSSTNLPAIKHGFQEYGWREGMESSLVFHQRDFAWHLWIHPSVPQLFCRRTIFLPKGRPAICLFVVTGTQMPERG